jgi:hypothetical protein
MTTDNFGFYFQNRLMQTSQKGGQRYSDSSPFSIPCMCGNLSCIQAEASNPHWPIAFNF